jgi:hypothetical protein
VDLVFDQRFDQKVHQMFDQVMHLLRQAADFAKLAATAPATHHAACCHFLQLRLLLLGWRVLEAAASLLQQEGCLGFLASPTAPASPHAMIPASLLSYVAFLLLLLLLQLHQRQHQSACQTVYCQCRRLRQKQTLHHLLLPAGWLFAAATGAAAAAAVG